LGLKDQSLYGIFLLLVLGIFAYEWTADTMRDFAKLMYLGRSEMTDHSQHFLTVVMPFIIAFIGVYNQWKWGYYLTMVISTIGLIFMLMITYGGIVTEGILNLPSVLGTTATGLLLPVLMLYSAYKELNHVRFRDLFDEEIDDGA